VHGDDGVAGVVAAGEQPLLLELGEQRLHSGALAGQLLGDRVVLGRELLERLEVVDLGRQRAVAVELALRARVLGGDLRGALLVVPEALLPHLVLERADARL
jgi:hypothetical protein